MLRRIVAACALFAVVAMGVALPAEAGARRDDSAASASGLDAALVVMSARRARVRGTAAELDGRSGGDGHVPFGLFHPLWLGAALSLPAPALVDVGGLAGASLRAPATPMLLGSRTSRGPPLRL